jgi:hypothetical protein
MSEERNAPYERLLLARVTRAIRDRHAEGKRTVAISDLLTALGESGLAGSRRVKDRIAWMEMEWHDDWSFLDPPEPYANDMSCEIPLRGQYFAQAFGPGIVRILEGEEALEVEGFYHGVRVLVRPDTEEASD